MTLFSVTAGVTVFDSRAATSADTRSGIFTGVVTWAEILLSRHHLTAACL